MEKTLPYGVIFPPDCVRCGSEANGTRDVVASSGFDVIIFSFKREVDIPAPTCGGCRSLRFAATIVGIALVIGALMGSVAALVTLQLDGDIPHELMLVVLIPTCIFLIHFGRNGIDRVLDHLILGVSARRLDTDRRKLVLRFMDPRLADETERLTRELVGDCPASEPRLNPF